MSSSWGTGIQVPSGCGVYFTAMVESVRAVAINVWWMLSRFVSPPQHLVGHPQRPPRVAGVTHPLNALKSVPGGCPRPCGHVAEHLVPVVPDGDVNARPE